MSAIQRQPGFEHRWKVRKRDTGATWFAFCDHEGWFRVTSVNGMSVEQHPPPRFTEDELNELFEEISGH